ncbi:MAG: AsmA family protein, partial [Flavobacteriales bacterium]|nr:AsmA family protein [Flavobacteriales bacterium]
MKKVLKIVGVVFILLIAAIVVLPIIFKDDIIQLVKDEANNNLNATIDFGDFDLSIISTFPNFMFSINDVSVVGVGEFEGVTLASIGTLQTTLDINSVIDGETIKIISFELIDVTANAIVLKDSTANWDIVKSTGEEEEEIVEEAPTEETKFSLGLEHYAFKNINVVYDDRPGNMYAEIKNFSHEGDGDFTQDIFLLNTLTSIEEITVRMDGIKYLNKANIETKFDIEIDNPNAKYTFKENSFRINAFELAFDGWVAMPTDDIELDLSFQTNKPDFKSLLSLVPAVYLTDFADVKTEGKVAFNGTAKGTYGADGSLPAFDLNLLVENAMFKYPDLPKSVDNIQIKVNVKNPGGSEDNTIVDIAQFHVEMGDNPVDIKMNVKTPVSDPNMMGSIKAQVNLASMKEFIPMEEG